MKIHNFIGVSHEISVSSLTNGSRSCNFRGSTLFLFRILILKILYVFKASNRNFVSWLQYSCLLSGFFLVPLGKRWDSTCIRLSLLPSKCSQFYNLFAILPFDVGESSYIQCHQTTHTQTQINTTVSIYKYS
jgi:hypothetical protein